MDAKYVVNADCVIDGTFYKKGQIVIAGSNIGLKPQISKIVCEADVAGNLDGTYITLASTTTKYYVWVKVSGATNTDPAPSGYTSGGYITIASGATAATVATAFNTAIGAIGSSGVFTSSRSTATLTVTNQTSGVALEGAGAGTSGFTVTCSQAGNSLLTALTADNTRKVNSPTTYNEYNTQFFPFLSWDDMQFSSAKVLQGAGGKPDYDYTNNGLLFPQNDATEIVYATAQFPHSMYTGVNAVISPHIHAIQAGAGQAVFKMYYRFIQRDATVGAFIGPITSTGYRTAYVSGSLAQIIDFDDISVEGLTPSAQLDIQVWRDDNAYSGDILVKSIDFHIQLDSRGSGQEWLK